MGTQRYSCSMCAFAPPAEWNFAEGFTYTNLATGISRTITPN